MKRTKVIYILSDISFSPAFIWITKGIDRKRIDLQFIFLNPGVTKLEEQIADLDIRIYKIQLSGKKDYPKVWLKCYKLLKSIKPDIVHCHLFDASLIGLSAAKAAGVKRRIHTRHHGDLHHVSFPRGVCLDRLVNKLSTEVIAPSEVVRQVLVEMDRINPKKVRVINHGFKFIEFIDVSIERLEKLRTKYQIPGNEGPVIGVISRWTEWKGVHIAIKAFSELRKNHPAALLVLANAGGDYEQEILQLLHELPEKSYRVIDFEEDVAALYKSFDVFVHVPIREAAEAFGQTYLEALIAEKPTVFTRSGVACELDVDIEFTDFEDWEGVLNQIEINLYQKPGSFNGQLKKYSSACMIQNLEKLYLEHW